jgi:multiple sugar transport system ATP-binding protein
VAVGRAVVREGPAAFLLDDALAHLDAAQRLEARAELGRIHRELRSTIVSVTHDQAEALAVGNRVAVMNGGVLEQVGTPRALYGMPASIFVAGFVGTPPMNLVEMTVEHHGDEVLLRSDGIALSIREPARSILDRSTGPAVTVGIRPEHLRVGEDPLPDEVTVRGVCDLVEFLGHHVLVHLRVGGLELRAFDDPAKQLRRGHVVDVGIPLDRLRLFDTATGRALDAWAPAPR